PFVGKIQVQDGDASMNGDVTGEIQLAPTVGRFNDPVIVGKLVGQLADGREVNVSLGEGVRLGPTLQNNPRRLVEADVVREGGDLPLRIGHLSGSIRRSFWNWFAVPLSHAEDQALHGQLGKYHELALVFTMIAGLLNILAVWDAVDGPAYGYGLDMEELDSDPAKDAAAPVRESARVSGAV
ncbi:MAG: hypothetical protein KF861_20015, partial [Planctomycetaceae bacterium]|nr:hypothetical protein [Planctomycetaceae bacterium]